jgi:DNA-binding transcriptional ArsR family regulator
MSRVLGCWRSQILEELRAGELSAGEIAGRFPISGPSVSRHLGVLKTAGLIRERREANGIFYSLAEERLALCVGRFLSAVHPDQFVVQQHARKLQKGTGAGHEVAHHVERHPGRGIRGDGDRAGLAC